MCMLEGGRDVTRLSNYYSYSVVKNTKEETLTREWDGKEDVNKSTVI